MWLLIINSIVICGLTIAMSKRRKYNPIILFNGIWLIAFVLYKINYLDFIDLTDKSILILFIMITLFPLGVILGIYNKHKIVFSGNRKRNNKKKEIVLREKIYIVLCAITILVMFIDELSIIISLINGSSFEAIIASASGKGTVVISGALQVSLYIFIVNPVGSLISPITAVLFMTNHDKKWRYFVLNILVVTLSVLHHGGRNSIYTMMISYILAFIIYDKKTRFRRRTKFFMTMMLVFAIALVNMISLSRGFDEIGSSFYAYLTCSMPLMQIYIERLGSITPYLGGFLSFNGIAYPLMSILQYLGLPYPSLYTETQAVRFFVEDHYMHIGGYSRNMNAFMPAGAYFYFDGGYIFEIVGMFLYGFIMGATYKKIYRDRDIRITAFYILMSSGLILSFTRFWFTSYGFALAAVYILLLFKSTSKIENNNEIITEEEK